MIYSLSQVFLQSALHALITIFSSFLPLGSHSHWGCLLFGRRRHLLSLDYLLRQILRFSERKKSSRNRSTVRPYSSSNTSLNNLRFGTGCLTQGHGRLNVCVVLVARLRRRGCLGLSFSAVFLLGWGTRWRNSRSMQDIFTGSEASSSPPGRPLSDWGRS